MAKISVSIVGASGYTGRELIGILSRHPNVKLTHLSSESHSGEPIHQLHKQLYGRCNLFCEKLDIKKFAENSEVIFSALPPSAGVEIINQFFSLGRKVIDLSADFRLKDKSAYEQWYNFKHSYPALLSKAVYGLPELFREKIKKARIVANPGCYATAITLGASPLLTQKWVKKDTFVADAKSGVSGAGKKLSLKYLYSQCNENFSAYNVALHRHTPEIEQTFTENFGCRTKVLFVPHLAPMDRGIFATLYFDLTKKIETGEALNLFANFYKNEPFVDVLPEGEFPETRDVRGTNFCAIGVKADQRTKKLIVLVCIDNLIKGASGQAVQNMNLISGFPEKMGLVNNEIT
ncbi:MAG: N-acetyl-gamma-glutamyl-phosphate reductase [Elusimicrobiota bacterium]